MYKYSGEPKWGVPKNKDMNLSLAVKETYKGLGTGANEWVDWFMRQLAAFIRARASSGRTAKCIRRENLYSNGK
jgi:hypothetical protein